MNWVDIIIGLAFLIAIVMGYYRGFIRGSLDLIGWIGSLVLGYMFYQYTARWIGNLTDAGVWQMPLAFIVTALVARVLLAILARLITRRLPERSDQSRLNRVLGILPGAITGWIVSIILSALLLSLPLTDNLNSESRDSRWATELAMQSEWVNKKLAPVFDQAVRHTMQSLTVHPESKESIALGFTYDKPQVRPFLEAQMLEMVNAERAKEGLKPLKADPELARVARAHSRDMFARGFFAHNTPEGKTPFDRMRAANVKFSTAGENLALAQTLEIAHINLMNSPGHRANIMHPDFGRLGIGVLDGGFYGLMISQEFRN